MQYMLIMTEPAAEVAKRAHPEHAGAYWGGWSAYVAALTKAGIVVSGAGLEPPATATTIRIRNGKREVQDGPFADTKEQLGGYFVIEAPDLDAALEWAARSPSASCGSVEVRPVLPPMPPAAA
jgi:hypothetical protein